MVGGTPFSHNKTLVRCALRTCRTKALYPLRPTKGNPETLIGSVGGLPKDLMTGESPVVLVVDDDASVLHALRRLIRAAGFEVRTFSTPREILGFDIPCANACLVLDVNLPEMSGVELHEALIASGRGLPAIMITGRSDARTQCLLHRAHTVAVLFKPFDEIVLIDAITRALAESRAN